MAETRAWRARTGMNPRATEQRPMNRAESWL